MSQNFAPKFESSQNTLLLTPQSKNPFQNIQVSPFSRSIAKILPPIDNCQDLNPAFFAGPQHNICTPKNLSKFLISPSPLRPDRQISFIRNSRSIQRLDFSVGPSTVQLNAMQMGVSIVRQDDPQPIVRPRPKKRTRESSSSKKVTCNCQKSRCLKLYCDCFSAGLYCQNCNCLNCQNTADYEGVRREAIANTLDRNPNAFKPKIKTVSKNGENASQHNRGCNCTKSACLKKYCECFQSGVKCSEICKCTGCRNNDENRVFKKRSERLCN